MWIISSISTQQRIVHTVGLWLAERTAWSSAWCQMDFKYSPGLSQYLSG